VTRSERIAEAIREEISRIILHELSDPRIGFVTVTGVDLSPDLTNARVLVSVMGTDAQKRTNLRGLRHSASFIQTAVFRRMRLRRPPRVEFELDETVERAYKMSKLIREARASDPDGGAVPTEPVPGPAEKTEAAAAPERPSTRKAAAPAPAPAPAPAEGEAEEEPPIEEF